MDTQKHKSLENVFFELTMVLQKLVKLVIFSKLKVFLLNFCLIQKFRKIRTHGNRENS